MLFDLYKDIRDTIAEHYGLKVDSDSGTVISPDPENIPLRDIQWFNDQFKHPINIAPLLLVDFDKCEFTEMYKGEWMAPLRVRLYVVSDSISLSDRQRHDADLGRHDTICDTIIHLLHRTKFTSTEKPLILASIQQVLDYEGWLVTAIEFDTRIALK